MVQSLAPEDLHPHGLQGTDAETFAKAFNAIAEAKTSEDCWRDVVCRLRTDVHPFGLYRFLHSHVFQAWDTTKCPTPAWSPTKEEAEATNIGQLMRSRGFTSYQDIHAWSVKEPEVFWDTMVREVGVRFRKPYEKSLDLSAGAEQPRWLPGAEYNVLDSCFGREDDAPAILHAGAGEPVKTITYGELGDLVNRVANGLSDAGLKAGDAVAIDMPMTPESVAIYLGIVSAGMVVVSIADSMAPNEIATRLKIGKAKAVFTQDVIPRAGKKLPMLEKVISAGAPRAIVLAGSGDLDRSLLRPEDLRWEDFLSTETHFEPIAGNAHTFTNVLFSSGTTGTPKAIPWNQATPVKAAIDGFLHLNIKPGQVVAWPTNLGWMMGPWLIYASLVNRASIALYADAPNTRAFCAFVRDAKVNVLGLVPSLVKAWRSQDALKGIDWSAVQCFGSTGECSNADDYLYLMVMSGHKPVIEYCGGTEIGGAYITGSMVQPASPATFSTKALGSEFILLDEAGEPTENGEVYLVPPAMGLSLEIINRDHHAEYFEDTPKGPDGQPLRRHGDQIERLPGDYFRAHGRVDDTMNLGGIKVSSIEIERLLDVLPGVSRTAAIAVPPPGGGPRILVIYAVRGSEATKNDDEALHQSMQNAIKTKLNPLFKIHDVVWVDALPVTASNKVMRRTLRARYEKERRDS